MSGKRRLLVTHHVAGKLKLSISSSSPVHARRPRFPHMDTVQMVNILTHSFLHPRILNSEPLTLFDSPSETTATQFSGELLLRYCRSNYGKEGFTSPRMGSLSPYIAQDFKKCGLVSFLTVSPDNLLGYRYYSRRKRKCTLRPWCVTSLTLRGKSHRQFVNTVSTGDTAQWEPTSCMGMNEAQSCLEQTRDLTKCGCFFTGMSGETHYGRRMLFLLENISMYMKFLEAHPPNKIHMQAVKPRAMRFVCTCKCCS